MDRQSGCADTEYQRMYRSIHQKDSHAMTTTFIDTNKISRTKVPGSGEFAEILNNKLCGAKNVVGTLRWLNNGEKLDVRSDNNAHQLLYLMQGEATITLNSKDHKVGKGSGVYVGP